MLFNFNFQASICCHVWVILFQEHSTDCTSIMSIETYRFPFNDVILRTCTHWTPSVSCHQRFTNNMYIVLAQKKKITEIYISERTEIEM